MVTQAVVAPQGVPFVRPDLPDFDGMAGSFRDALDPSSSSAPGAYVEQLEEAVSGYLRVPVAAVSSGTIGLLFTLQALGLRIGQRVVLPSFCSAATAQAICYAGGLPTFAEIDASLTLDPDDLEQLLAHHDDVGAVVPAHTGGLPCQVNEIQHIVDAASRRRGRPIPVVYDAAHAFDASVDGRRVGTFGNAEIFSLSTSTAIAGVGGGLVATHNIGLVRRVRKMRNYGLDLGGVSYWPGLGASMSDLHAIVALASLEGLAERTAERRRNADTYAESITRATSCRLPSCSVTANRTFERFTILLPDELQWENNEILEWLEERGVHTTTDCSPPLHTHPYFRQFADRDLSVTEHISRRAITLPFFTSMSAREMEYVVAALVDAEHVVRRALGFPATADVEG